MENGNPIRAAKREANKLDEIRAMGLAGDLDPDELHDLIEGETDLFEVLCAVGEQIQMFEGEMLPGIKNRIDELQKRQSRMKHSAETLRSIVLSHMERAEIPTIKGPCFTMSARATARGLVIESEAEIPSAYFKPQDPKRDNQAILAALKDGTEVPGASLDNGRSTLSIRLA